MKRTAWRSHGRQETDDCWPSWLFEFPCLGARKGEIRAQGGTCQFKRFQQVAQTTLLHVEVPCWKHMVCTQPAKMQKAVRCIEALESARHMTSKLCTWKRTRESSSSSNKSTNSSRCSHSSRCRKEIKKLQHSDLVQEFVPFWHLSSKPTRSLSSSSTGGMKVGLQAIFVSHKAFDRLGPSAIGLGGYHHLSCWSCLFYSTNG